MELNNSQLEIINHSSGPLLVVAGAGTGKTRVIIERIINQVIIANINLDNILAVTFTEKAAREMQDRLGASLPLYSRANWVTTFHSFCDRILRAEAIHLGLNQDYQIVQEIEGQLLLKDILIDSKLEYFVPLSNPLKYVQTLHNYFNRLLDEGITPVEYDKYFQKIKGDLLTDEKLKELELSQLFTKYQQEKARLGIMDYADLLYYTLKLFQGKPHILKKYQQQFKEIIIDEFQDTNRIQYELIKSLCVNDTILIAVGDDDQSIYQFRGATVSNILRFKEDFPRAKIVTLTQNYRSGQNILDAAYRLISNNNPQRLETTLNISKHLIAHSKIPGQITLIESSSALSEASQIAQVIKGLLKQGLNYNDIAILSRAHAYTDEVTQIFLHEEIPFSRIRSLAWSANHLIRDILAYLRILVDGEDNQSAYSLLSSPSFGIETSLLNTIHDYASRHPQNYFEALEKFKDKASMEDLHKIDILQSLIQEHGSQKRPNIGEIVYELLKEFKIFESLADIGSVEDEQKAESLGALFENIQTYQKTARAHTIPDFLSFVESTPEGDTDEYQPGEGVAILTIHSAKGLEFPVVFVISMVNERFPARKRGEGLAIPDQLRPYANLQAEEHIHEERRLAYVAITRAQTHLYLTFSKSYSRRKKWKISDFIPQALPNWESLVQENSDQLGLFDEMKLTNFPVTNQPPSANINRISFSQISTYETCPLQYQYRYLLKLPYQESEVTTFGIIMHKAMEIVGQKKLAGENLTIDDIPILYDTVWEDKYFSDKKSKDIKYQRGLLAITEYVDKYFATDGQILALEKSFMVPLPNGVELSGKFDRVDQNSDGIHIIDYKTSKVADDSILKQNLQLNLYAFAALITWPTVSLENITLSIYSFSDSTFHTVTCDDKNVARRIEKTIETVAKINSYEFPAKVSELCRHCAFNRICPAYQSTIMVKG